VGMSRYFFICFLARILLKLLFRVDVKGVEHIPSKGAFLIAPNHISFLDPVVAGAFVPRDLHYMSRENLFDIFFLGRLLRICQSLPVRKDKPHPQTMRKAISILKEGEGLLIFPEGTRSINGKLRKGSPGIGMLACISGAPIIPAKVSGTEKALPVGAKWIRLEKIQVRFGKPVFPDEVASDGNKRTLYQKLTDEVMQRIGDLQTSPSSSSNPPHFPFIKKRGGLRKK
jgi:1-acyl-sn-glycerol-3-phosphate acyltransferase